jgi:hypothetical protein
MSEDKIDEKEAAFVAEMLAEMGYVFLDKPDGTTAAILPERRGMERGKVNPK